MNKTLPICFTLIALFFGFGLSGCASLHNNYETPMVQMPAQWERYPTEKKGGLFIEEAWWEQFGDPQLNRLIVESLRRNNDLAAATVRIQRARLQADLAHTNLAPSFSVESRSQQNRYLNSGDKTKNYSVTAALNYELDLWGKLSAARETARWKAEATEMDRQTAALSLIGTTASLYWQIAYLHERLAKSSESIDYAEKTLRLTQARYNAGKISKLDMFQAEQNLQSQQAEHTQLNRQITETRHALAILFDQNPQYRVLEKTELSMQTLPDVPAGLPVELLRRRPDLQAAEMRLRSLSANLDQTRASFFPTFTLTGSLGGSSTSLGNVLRDPVGTLGLGLFLPFVEWRTTQLSIKVSETEYEEAIINFRQNLYQALREVEDSLSARIYYGEQEDFLAKTLRAAQEADKLSEERYIAGKTSIQSWLDQQSLRRSAEIGLLQNRLDQINTRMKIYLALGGSDKKYEQKNR